jgi:hypothetical protein
MCLEGGGQLGGTGGPGARGAGSAGQAALNVGVVIVSVTQAGARVTDAVGEFVTAITSEAGAAAPAGSVGGAGEGVGADAEAGTGESADGEYSGAQPDDVLVRRGKNWESTSRLSRQAQDAEAAGFPHGVSVTTPDSNARLARDPEDASTAARKALEDAGFPVHHTPTKRDPKHHTAQLPKPVMPEDARRFNEVFGRTRGPR